MTPQTNKTALMELIEWINKEVKFFGGPDDTIEDKHTATGLRFASEKATALLEKEKQQIIEAHDQGEGKVLGGGEKYYQETFQFQNLKK